MKILLSTVLFAVAVSTPSFSDSLIYSYNDTGEHRIHIRDMETGDDRIVSPAGGAAWNATFSPSGSHFVYTWQKDDTSQVFIAPVGEGEHVQLTSGDLTAYHPSFSPDGSLIVFSDWGANGIAIMNRDGTNQHLFAEHERGNSHPVFFQDGMRILFNSRRLESADKDPGIFIYNVETDQVQHTGYFGTYARPSHDGKWIVFAGKSLPEADRDIMLAKLADKTGIIPLSASTPISLTQGGGYDGHPSFTEDDQSIVFVSRRAQSLLFPPAEESDTAGSNEVFIMDRDGKNITRLTHDDAVAWHPEIFSGPVKN